MMNKIKVGIQGIQASFHDVAARKHFRGTPTEVLECETFPVLCKKLSLGEMDYAIMAIENTIAGSLLPNYLLLENYHFHIVIVGEVYLRIKLNLMALPGTTMENLKFVQSHPIAIQQSMEFLMQHPVKILEVNDTAESAKLIRDEKLQGYGAIAGEEAAKAYGLEILAEEIETNPQNYTRFLVISNNKPANGAAVDKASIRFEHEHRPGSLVDVLTVFKDHQINLTKLQSVPVLGKPYEYSFHVDMEWENYEQYRQALEKVKTQVHSLNHFGEYKKGEKPFA